MEAAWLHAPRWQLFWREKRAAAHTCDPVLTSLCPYSNAEAKPVAFTRFRRGLSRFASGCLFATYDYVDIQFFKLKKKKKKQTLLVKKKVPFENVMFMTSVTFSNQFILKRLRGHDGTC